MEAEKLFKLIDAGFTKDDIMQIISKSTVAGSDPEPETPAEPERPAEHEAPAVPDMAAIFNPFIDEMKKIVSDMQAANLRSAQQHEEPPLKPEELLAEIIYPTK